MDVIREQALEYQNDIKATHQKLKDMILNSEPPYLMVDDQIDVKKLKEWLHLAILELEMVQVERGYGKAWSIEIYTSNKQDIDYVEKVLRKVFEGDVEHEYSEYTDGYNYSEFTVRFE